MKEGRREEEGRKRRRKEERNEGRDKQLEPFNYSDRNSPSYVQFLSCKTAKKRDDFWRKGLIFLWIIVLVSPDNGLTEAKSNL